MEFGKIIFGIIGLCLLSEYSDAAITGWTTPTIGTASGSGAVTTPKIAENLAVGASTAITIVATTGATSIDAYTLTTATVGGATFSIANDGLLTFASGTLDFETNPTLVIIIEAEDDTGAKGTATVTVSVSNIDEAPVYAAGAVRSVTVADGSAAGTSVATMTATDPEEVAVAGYTIASGNTNTDFAIAATTGAITVANTLAAATTPLYVLLIESNEGTVTGTATLVVNVGSTSSCSGVAGLTVSMVTVLVASLIAFLK